MVALPLNGDRLIDRLEAEERIAVIEAPRRPSPMKNSVPLVLGELVRAIAKGPPRYSSGPD